jgi:hypothetical protein
MAERDSDSHRASGESPLKHDGASIRLTILDLMAAFIPGLAWLLVLTALWHLRDPDPLAMTLAALHLPPKSWMELVPAVLAAFTVGYAVKPVVLTVAGWLSFEKFCVRERHEQLGSASETARVSASLTLLSTGAAGSTRR